MVVPTNSIEIKRFLGNMPRKCKINSRKRCYNKSRNIEQLYSHKYVPTTTITTSVGRKHQGNMVAAKNKNEKMNLLNKTLKF
ncbi:unnamed protein product [Sphagnum compactum]